LLFLAIPLASAGCSSDYEVDPAYDSTSLVTIESEAPEARTDSPPAASQAPPEASPMSGPTSQPSGPGPAEQRAEGSSTAQTPPSESGRRTPNEPAAPEQPSIRLSAGVALPQSLPTGTAMGFSVDYQFSSGEPSTTSPYVWVVQPAKGEPAKQSVRLSGRGTLQNFFPQFRPENGPFSTHIEDANGNRLSRSLPLR
jgi:hypothetical protein